MKKLYISSTDKINKEFIRKIISKDKILPYVYIELMAQNYIMKNSPSLKKDNFT